MRRRASGPEPLIAKNGRAGFSMIEVIVAMLILTVGVLGLAGTTAYIVRQVTLGDLMTERSAAFQTIIDRLQSLPYDSVTSGNSGMTLLRPSLLA